MKLQTFFFKNKQMPISKLEKEFSKMDILNPSVNLTDPPLSARESSAEESLVHIKCEKNAII